MWAAPAEPLPPSSRTKSSIIRFTGSAPSPPKTLAPLATSSAGSTSGRPSTPFNTPLATRIAPFAASAKRRSGRAVGSAPTASRSVRPATTGSPVFGAPDPARYGASMVLTFRRSAGSWAPGPLTCAPTSLHTTGLRSFSMSDVTLDLKRLMSQPAREARAPSVRSIDLTFTSTSHLSSDADVGGCDASPPAPSAEIVIRAPRELPATTALAVPDVAGRIPHFTETCRWHKTPVSTTFTSSARLARDGGDLWLTPIPPMWIPSQ